MSHTIKKSLIIVFTLALAFCVGLFCFTLKTVKADNADDDYSQDYVITSAPTLDVGAVTIDGLRWTVNVNNQEHADVGPLGIPEIYDAFVKIPAPSYFDYVFTLYRDNGEKAPTAVSILNVYVKRTATAVFHRQVAVVQLIDGEPQLNIDDGFANHGVNNAPFTLHENDLELTTIKYTKLSGDSGIGGLVPFGKDSCSVYANINATHGSDYQKYYVSLTYDYCIYTDTNIFDNDWIIPESTIESKAYSIYDILKEKQDAGTLESEFSYFPLMDAKAILATNATQDVKIEYLEEIAGTPFAKRVQKTVKIPVHSGGIYASDVFSALGVDCLKVYDANAQSFKLENDASDVYVADYYKSCWLRAITVDGNYMDVFADFNSSFKDYFYKMVEDGVLASDVYSHMWNALLTKYPKVGSLTPDKLYGLWGFVVVPETYSLNSIWGNIFSPASGMNSGNIYEGFSFKSLMKYAEYNAIMTNYQYNWLQRAWSGVAGFVEGGSWSATYIFYYGKPNTSVSWVSFAGEKDEDDVKKPDQDGLIKDDINNAIDGIAGGIKEFLTSKKTATISGIVAISLVVVLVIVLLRRRK